MNDRPMEAAKATNRLLDFLPPLDVGDPEAFIAAIAAILGNYPPEVMAIACDPVRGIPSKRERPSLAFITEFCEEIYAPIVKAQADKARHIESRRELSKWDTPVRTPAEQARVDRQVAEVKQLFPVRGGKKARPSVAEQALAAEKLRGEFNLSLEVWAKIPNSEASVGK